MGTVHEIEQAIEMLPPADYNELLARIDARRAAQVDAKFEEAVLSGKFGVLARQAEHAIDAGESVPMEDFLRERV